MCPTNDPGEAVKYHRYIEVLAEEIQRPIEDVEPIYDDAVSHLKETATVGDYIPIFAWRRARDILRR